jgi:hypothetical protein
MASLQDEINTAEAAAAEAQQRVSKLKNEASRDAAKKAFLEMSLHTFEDNSDKLADHYSECHAVTRWLGRNGTTPKDSLKFFPVPVHSKSNVACPGCTCDKWQGCLRKAGFVY